MATFAVFRPRRIIRWTYLLRHTGRLRTVTCAASTSKKRTIELPCLVMSQSSTVPARFFQRHQSEIARHLLAAVKAFGVPDDLHEGQGGKGTNSGMSHQPLCLRTFFRFLLDGLA